MELLRSEPAGREMLADRLKGAGMPLERFLVELERAPPPRIPGTAVVLSSDLGTVPPVLLQHLRHNKVLHERVLLVTVRNEEVTYVPDAERIEVEQLGKGFVRVIDESGEDYLYPLERFVAVELPQAAVSAFAETS